MKTRRNILVCFFERVYISKVLYSNFYDAILSTKKILHFFDVLKLLCFKIFISNFLKNLQDFFSRINPTMNSVHVLILFFEL